MFTKDCIKCWERRQPIAVFCTIPRDASHIMDESHSHIVNDRQMLIAKEIGNFSYKKPAKVIKRHYCRDCMDNGIVKDLILNGTILSYSYAGKV